MNNKGQSAIYVFLVLIIFAFVWIAGLSGWIAEVGQAAVVAGNLTGINAFFYANFNLLIGIFLFIALATTAKFGFG